MGKTMVCWAKDQERLVGLSMLRAWFDHTIKTRHERAARQAQATIEKQASRDAALLKAERRTTRALAVALARWHRDAVLAMEQRVFSAWLQLGSEAKLLRLQEASALESGKHLALLHVERQVANEIARMHHAKVGPLMFRDAASRTLMRRYARWAHALDHALNGWAKDQRRLMLLVPWLFWRWSLQLKESSLETQVVQVKEKMKLGYVLMKWGMDQEGILLKAVLDAWHLCWKEHSCKKMQAQLGWVEQYQGALADSDRAFAEWELSEFRRFRDSTMPLTVRDGEIYHPRELSMDPQRRYW